MLLATGCLLADGFVPDSFWSKHCLPVGIHAGLLAEAEEEDAIGGEGAVHGEENLATGFLGEVNHDVAEKDDVAGFPHHGRLAEIVLLKAAEALD